MATRIRSVIRIARQELTDPQAKEWSDTELARHCLGGIKDLWRSITPLHEDFFSVVDDESMSVPATAGVGGAYVTGVPEDVYKVVSIEPATKYYSAPYFEPRSYQSIDAQYARRFPPIDASSNEIVYYSITQPGANAGAPRIHCAPSLTSSIQLSVTYVQSLTGFILGLITKDTGRFTNFSGPLPSPSAPSFWKEVNLEIPISGEGQITWPNTATPAFKWSDFEGHTAGEDGGQISVSTIVYAFSVPHTGASGSGDQDYSEKVVDISSVYLGKSGGNKLLMSVNTDTGRGALFNENVSVLIESLTRSAGDAEENIDLDKNIPLPGDPDQALAAYTIAWARAKETSNRAPDTTWLAVYKAEKDNLINSLTPRQEFGPVVTAPSSAFDN